VGHLQANGFEVATVEVPDMAAIKSRHGVPAELEGCHTGEVDGYIIEGHVPAEDLRRLLAERPEVKGLSVPGMPLGSPGMEMPTGETEHYDVLTFDEDGKTTVFSQH
jgi:hypothetical protein